MTAIDLIGVPFDGYGRAGNQARASTVLREAGFAAAFAGRDVVDAGDLALPPGDPARAPGSGLMNERALVAQTRALREAVARSIRTGRFPVVYGGDCTSLLGSIGGLRDTLGDAALVFADGHEDTMPLDVVEDGEAANTEIALLIGLTGHFAPEALRQRPLEPDALAMVGQRDADWRLRFNVGSLRDRGVWLRDAGETAADPAAVGRQAVAHVTTRAEGWWLHIDLDVLDPLEFAAQGLPGDNGQPGGLSWPQLTQFALAAVETGGCRGLSLAIYDPDQDRQLFDAARIVGFAGDIAAKL
jgi:arginase